MGYQVTEIGLCPECLRKNPKLLLLGNAMPFKFSASNNQGDTIQ
jgi:hypothetical protein